MKALHCVLVLMVLLCGCKEDDPTGVQFTTIADKSDVFKVNITAVVPKDDNFSLYYTTDGSSNFNKNQLVWVPVKGKTASQEIVFTLPKNVKPSQLRIDLGNNPKQSDLYIQKFRMQCCGKSFEAPGTLVFSYFRPDVAKTDANPDNGLIRGTVKNGIRQSPSLYPKEGPLHDQIDRLLEE